MFNVKVVLLIKDLRRKYCPRGTQEKLRSFCKFGAFQMSIELKSRVAANLVHFKWALNWTQKLYN